MKKRDSFVRPGDMVDKALVSLYSFWHKTLRFRGGGIMLSTAARVVPELQSFRLKIPNVGEAIVDFRDVSAFAWLNYLLGDQLEEDGLIVALRRLHSAGSTVWDIGANCGFVSAMFFSIDPTVTIVAIEPNPSLMVCLQSLFAGRERVFLLQRGLSDTDGEIPFFVPVGGSSVGTFEIGTERNRPGKLMKVPVCRGDALLDEFPDLAPPSIIKVDVEGHEQAVFSGLARVIREHRPVIVFEHLFLTDEVIEALTPAGYRYASIHDNTGELIPGIERKESHNILLVPENGQASLGTAFSNGDLANRE